MAQSCTLGLFVVASLLVLNCGGSGAPNTAGNTGGIAGASATGGSSGADGGTGNLGPGCAGYGGVGGMPPHCNDGGIEAATQTSRGYCSTHEGCSGATPLCGFASPTSYAITCLACPEGMVSVGDSCVEPMEVTRGDYDAWIGSAPSTTGQTTECAWNATFAPDPTCMAKASVCQGACDSHPQVCVDWCDAQAYCNAKGARLCGAYPKNSFAGPYGLGFDDWQNENGGELLEACNETGVESYAYGPAFSPLSCNGSEAGVGTTVPVGSKPACAHAHAAGKIHDTTGNVREWEFACSAASGSSDLCRSRGGSFLDSGQSSTCWKVDKNTTRDAVAEDLGFRCCAP